MVGKEYTIRGAHVRGSTGVQYPGMLILESHLVQRGDEAGLVPHGSRLGDLERCEGHGRLHRREGHVSLRRHAETLECQVLWPCWTGGGRWGTHRL